MAVQNIALFLCEARLGCVDALGIPIQMGLAFEIDGWDKIGDAYLSAFGGYYEFFAQGLRESGRIHGVDISDLDGSWDRRDGAVYSLMEAEEGRDLSPSAAQALGRDAIASALKWFGASFGVPVWGLAESGSDSTLGKAMRGLWRPGHGPYITGLQTSLEPVWAMVERGVLERHSQSRHIESEPLRL